MECINLLKQKGYKISEKAVTKGLSTVIHKARFETIKKNPTIIYDGGHNENAAKNLVTTINQYYPDKKKVYIVSLLKTKDYKTVIKILTQDKNGIFIFTTGNDKNKYVDKEVLYTEAKKYTDNIYQEELLNALKIAQNKYKEEIIMIVGSFYVYKDVINNL